MNNLLGLHLCTRCPSVVASAIAVLEQFCLRLYTFTVPQLEKFLLLLAEKYSHQDILFLCYLLPTNPHDTTQLHQSYSHLV